MHDLRSAILSGEEVKPSTPIAVKKPRASRTREGSLAAVAVKREESRQTDQRSEDRHRNLVDEASITFRRRKYPAGVINVSPGGAMVDCDIEPRIGETVEIQFAGCNRAKATVRWVRGQRIGMEFRHETGIVGSSAVQDFIIRRLRGEDVPEDEGPRAKQERAPRHRMIWIGSIHCQHGSVPTRVRNISSEGAMLEIDQDFAVGTEILLDLDQGGTAFAKVCWANGGQIGVQFTEPFDLKRLADAQPVPVPALPRTVKPNYLADETNPSSPWAGMWDRLSIDDLTKTLARLKAKG